MIDRMNQAQCGNRSRIPTAYAAQQQNATSRKMLGDLERQIGQAAICCEQHSREKGCRRI